MADKNQIKEAYKTGKYTFKKLAEEFNVSLGTIKSWAKRDKDDGQPWEKGCNQHSKVSNKGKKKVATKRNVTVDKKEQVLTLAAIGKSKNEISREVGIARSTVRNIINMNPDELSSYRLEKKTEFIQRAWDTVNKALEFGNQKIILATVTADTFDEKIEDLIQTMKDNKAEPKAISDTIKALCTVMNIPLKDVAVYIGTIYDKIALATGGATANVNLNNVTPTEEAMKQMPLEELRQLAKLE